MKYTEKELEEKINQLSIDFKENKINKKQFLKKQLEYMEYCLEHKEELKLSKVKIQHIKNTLILVKTTLRFI